MSVTTPISHQRPSRPELKTTQFSGHRAVIWATCLCLASEPVQLSFNNSTNVGRWGLQAPPVLSAELSAPGSRITPCTTDRSEAPGGEATSQGRRLTLGPPRGAGILTAPRVPRAGAPHPHSPEHPIVHAVAGRQRTPFLDPAELGAWVAGHNTVELHAGPYALGLQLRCDLDCGCGPCWCGRGGERAGGACGDRYKVVRMSVCV